MQTPNLDPPAPSFWATWLDRHAARPMFFLSFVFLALFSGVIHRIADGYVTFFEARLIAWGLLALWPIFVLDALCRFVVTRGQMSLHSRLFLLLCVMLFPWLRLGMRSYADPHKIWLPRVGWHVTNRALRRQLERFFSVPMVLFALLTLPVLTLEFYWESVVREHFWLTFSLDMANSLIWMAFVIEFTVLISLAEDRLVYALQNWMDLAVVILPILDFLPVLRLWQSGRLFQLNQLSRLSRLYRLRGMMTKAWRAILLLEILSRLLGNYKERRLKKLKDLIAAKQIELDELRQELAELEAALPKQTPTDEAAECDREKVL
jgi:hypothetical protein